MGRHRLPQQESERSEHQEADRCRADPLLEFCEQRWIERAQSLQAYKGCDQGRRDEGPVFPTPPESPDRREIEDERQEKGGNPNGFQHQTYQLQVAGIHRMRVDRLCLAARILHPAAGELIDKTDNRH